VCCSILVVTIIIIIIIPSKSLQDSLLLPFEFLLLLELLVFLVVQLVRTWSTQTGFDECILLDTMLDISEIHLISAYTHANAQLDHVGGDSVHTIRVPLTS
jgi:hypothetical protein